MLAARNARRSTGEKKASVVERQAVAVLSRGTLTDAEMVGAHPDASYALAGGAEGGQARGRRRGVDWLHWGPKVKSAWGAPALAACND